jgi:hypothetical protein
LHHFSHFAKAEQLVVYQPDRFGFEVLQVLGLLLLGLESAYGGVKIGRLCREYAARIPEIQWLGQFKFRWRNSPGLYDIGYSLPDRPGPLFPEAGSCQYVAERIDNNAALTAGRKRTGIELVSADLAG